MLLFATTERPNDVAVAMAAAAPTDHVVHTTISGVATGVMDIGIYTPPQISTSKLFMG